MTSRFLGATPDLYCDGEGCQERFVGEFGDSVTDVERRSVLQGWYVGQVADDWHLCPRCAGP